MKHEYLSPTRCYNPCLRALRLSSKNHINPHADTLSKINFKTQGLSLPSVSVYLSGSISPPPFSPFLLWGFSAEDRAANGSVSPLSIVCFAELHFGSSDEFPREGRGLFSSSSVGVVSQQNFVPEIYCGKPIYWGIGFTNL
ncbi:hypothetical protein NE237_027795 [Protea cynaroides]|uniref:Uncharacterized protein n=1 Tax=Protea cynaroides TaxID=273540 RepID=A0A9Q0GQT7_9MAGN|nr:hypothetical protein NE237_027795 [Protea cynaroides]